MNAVSVKQVMYKSIKIDDVNAKRKNMTVSASTNNFLTTSIL